MEELGVIVRADCGGLGNQTYEVWRHLKPAHTLVVHTHKSSRRGFEDTARYGTIAWEGYNTTVSPHTLRDFASQVSVVFAVETTSCHNGFEIVRDAGARSVLLANPELYRESEQGRPDVLRVPTDWAIQLLPGAKVLPQPVAVDRFTPRPVTECRTFYHPGAPAFHDRNGTDLLLAALHAVEEDCTVIVHEPHLHGSRTTHEQVGRVHLERRSTYVKDYWDVHPREADVMVMPRRYGGLCLPALETAAMGMPAVMTDIAPQSAWPHVVGVPARGTPKKVPMKGGVFPVWPVDPLELAHAMTSLVRDVERVKRLSARALEWANENSWDKLLPLWVGTLS